MHIQRRTLFRIFAVVLIVTQLAGFTCYHLDDSRIEYAPGYGYIVTVERDKTDGRTKDFYFVFDTLAQAEQFIREFPDLKYGVTQNRIPGGWKARYPESSDEGEEIERIKSPRLPAPAGESINRMIDRATPPLPTGPQPQ
ncbi:MAG: hypothetical protein ACK4FK_13655 [Ferrovibrio sp.]|jgi:hypothetical protein|uniref:hypothetical protein n=1 Tax=Ferrovibrio sp. TaxID=1917215 RepID=UPI00391DAEA1